ncbi:helix-turn-helix transcriptional regulator [Mycobacterium simiae]|uniref:helix-turn-helix transcriptional regulator n=1 Tax=Mycobacterium simiae TaxID=1784 RepID=UPI00260C61A3|nr:AraC family transcriptional regulator [Mycobacterium simiae]
MDSESTVAFDSDDPAEAEAFLGGAYATAFVGPRPAPPHRFSITRAGFGALDFGEMQLSCDINWQTEPLGKIRLSRVRSGIVQQRFGNGSTDTYGPGEVMIMGVPDRPFSGRCEHPHFDLVLLEPRLLQRVASSAPGRRARPVRLNGSRPVNTAARHRVASAIDHLHTLVRNTLSPADAPLVVATAADHLAAVLLASFPNNAVAEATIEDRHDTTPVLLRRAIAYIEDNAHADISLADIARAVYVTPRALQLTFRRHRDCTPTEYLRRVRLHHAHQDLVSADRAQATVTTIAARWGFAHVGRFAAYYRQAYGQSPHTTLRA